MSDELFKSQEEKETAVNLCRSGIISPFWQMILKILNENIEIVRKQIIDGTENETKETIDRLRDKLRVHEALRDLPDRIIKDFSQSETVVPETDPFQTTEQLIAERKK